MSKWSQKIEVAANVLIIIVALLLIGVFVQKYFFVQPDQSQQARMTPIVGKQIDLPNENWAAQPKTVVLVLQATCRFCNESAPFYKRLVEETKGKNIKLIAVFPTPVEESAAHLRELGVTGFEVKQSPISALDASGTPTLILANNKGEVTDYWVGKLPAEREAEVLNKLNS